MVEKGALKKFKPFFFSFLRFLRLKSGGVKNIKVLLFSVMVKNCPYFYVFCLDMILHWLFICAIIINDRQHVAFILIKTV